MDRRLNTMKISLCRLMKNPAPGSQHRENKGTFWRVQLALNSAKGITEAFWEDVQDASSNQSSKSFSESR